MPGNKNFPIDITANDKFTTVMEKFNKRMTSATQPIAALGKVTKELAEKSGLAHIAKGLTEIRSVAGEAGRELGVLSGPIGFLSGAGAIAGIAAMADRWAGVGRNLTEVSASSGVAASGLSRMQSAARLAGASGDAVSQSMQALADSTNDASLGRDNRALATLQTLQIHLARTSAGLVDTRKEFLDLLDAIAQQKTPQAQNEIARNTGIDRSLLTPDVRRGGASAWLEREDEAKKRGDNLSQGQIDGAKALDDSINRLKSSAMGVFNGVMDDISPTVKSVVDGVDSWVVKNGKAAKRMAEGAIGSGGIAALFNAGGILSHPLIAAGVASRAGGFAGAAASGIIFDYYEDAKRINNQIKDLGGFVDEAGNFHPLDASGADSNDTGRLISIPPSPTGTFSSGPSPTGTSLGLRSNNPGNLMPGGREAVYGSMHDGLEAAAENILGYNDRYGINTISGIVSRWAPPGENDTGAYISDVSRRTGFGPNQELDVHNPQVLESLLNAITHHEVGTDAGSHAQLAEAVVDALSRKPIAVHLDVTMSGAPQGTRVAATDSAGSPVPVRVSIRSPLSPTP